MPTLTTPTGRTYRVELTPIPVGIRTPQQAHHAYVVALTASPAEDARILQFATITADEPLARVMMEWQRIGATHYGVVAEHHPEREALALAAELGQTFGVPVRG